MDMIIKEGLLYEGEVVTGNRIGEVDPTRIIYTGSNSKEIEQLKKWAQKGKIKFEQKINETKPTKSTDKPVDKPVDKIENKIENKPVESKSKKLDESDMLITEADFE